MNTKTRLSPLAKLILDHYSVVVKGRANFLTDTMKRALVSDAMFSVMVSRYEKSGQEPMREYVRANLDVQKHLEL